MTLWRELVEDPRFKEAFKDTRIYGVAGPNGSGKDTALDALSEAGFLAFNNGDALRQVSQAVMGSTQRGGNDSPTGRIANAQRTTYEGGMVTLGLIDYWARVLHMDRSLQPKGLVIGSIRGVGEAEVLRQFGGKLIVVTTTPEVRYQRMVRRARSYEKSISFEQFMQEEKAEMADGETDPTKFGMAQVIAMGDIVIDNSQDNIESFKAELRQALKLN